MGEIEYLYDFVNLIDNLINKLYINEYLRFEDSCLNYANRIYQFIEVNIELSNHLNTPNELSHL